MYCQYSFSVKCTKVFLNVMAAIKKMHHVTRIINSRINVQLPHRPWYQHWMAADKVMTYNASLLDL